MNTEAIWTFLSTQGADFGLKVLAAIAAWIVGRWLIALALRVFTAALERGKRILWTTLLQEDVSQVEVAVDHSFIGGVLREEILKGVRR